jgi:CheY-like chemotaxis protein
MSQPPDRSAPILIVDDDPDMCWALQYILHKHGFPTEKVLTGLQALESVRSRHFSLVFLDAKLPDLDGLEVASLIRRTDPESRIIIVSGYFYRDDLAIQQALAAGLIQGFISKPFLQEEILNALKI